MSKTRRWIDRQQTPNTEEDEMRNRLEEIRERAEKATAGPWGIPEGLGGEKWVASGGWPFGTNIAECKNTEDATFIAHAREDIPYLLSLLETARDTAR